jgi:nitroimidazol reductase NimA-like FMN-containing flavoprotein (pyridoxamine 5'-phosphate oxidase superfamily)
VRRHPERALYDRASIHAVLDEQLVAHVAFVEDGQPLCIPMLMARAGDDLYVHGSAGSRAIRTLGRGVPACVTVTVLDGLVLAKSAFHHSANYRSVVLLGSFRAVEEANRVAAFEAFTDKLVPGRWAEVRRPSPKELRASAIVSMPIDEASAKARAGPPHGDPLDDDLHVWEGVIPIVTRFGDPQPAPGLHEGIGLAPSARRLLRNASHMGG